MPRVAGSVVPAVCPVYACRTQMEFRILGPLEVCSEGREIPLGGAKQRAVLAVLLLHRNEVVSTDRVIDELWSDRPPATAPKVVQVYVSQLRKALRGRHARDEADSILVTRAPGYLLRIERGELDADHFEQLVDEGRRALAAGSPRLAAHTLLEGLALWRGPAFADFAHESFAQNEIARLEEARVSALEERIDADLALGRHAELIGELESLVAAYPLRERLRGQLMLALYRSGRQVEALDAFRAARSALVDELGLEPRRELRELQQAVLRQDAALDLAARVEPAPEPPHDLFVGRGLELEELRAGLNDAFARRGRLFLLVGEPGIGKSRLADELIADARARGASVVIGRCWEAGGAPAYWPWVQALRLYVEQSDPGTLRSELGSGAPDLAQIVPELRELFPDLPQPSLEVEGARFRLFDSVGHFLRNAAASRPLVLVLDDLHVADEPSLLLLRFVAGGIAGSRILVVGTYRDVDPTMRDPLASTLAELAREQVTRRIELGGLTEEDISEYVKLTAGTTPSAGLSAAIHTETGGNALFVAEVVRLLAADGHVSDIDARELWTLGIPQGVREVIGRRLRRLSEECVVVLTLASVLGREFALDALQRLTEVPADELLDLLDEPVAARVLTSVPGARGRLRFGHALVRETLYEGLTTPRRVQLHRRAGEALEALYAQDQEPHLAELAHHFLEAAPGGDLDKALGYAQRAGDRALELLAYEEAARLYELALQALELQQPVDLSARYALLVARGDALARGGSTPEAEQAFLAAADLARASLLPEHLARAALGYGGRFPWLRAGSDPWLVPLLEEALEALGETEPVLRVKLLARLAGALRDQPSLEPRASLSRQAVEIARGLGDPDTLGYALASLFTATWGPELGEPATIAEEVTRLAEETGEAERALDACRLRWWVALSLGDVAAVERAADDHRALAEQLKQPSLQWYNVVMRSTLAIFQGEFAEGERIAEEALQLGQQAQSRDAGFSYRIALFSLRREQGRLEEIEDMVRQTVDEYPGYRSFRCLLALLEWELGHREETRGMFDELAADDFAALPRDAEWLFCLSVLAEVAAYLQDRDRAAILHRQLLPYARLNAVAAGEVAIGSVARYLGLLATTMGHWNEAAQHFEDALEMNERMGARPWLAHTQHDYARTLLARDEPGDRERAQELLHQALATYRELGIEPSAAKASAVPRTP
jgi:DNA-binding SARP family transcriptional activator